jgi:hypothetical protein
MTGMSALTTHSDFVGATVNRTRAEIRAGELLREMDKKWAGMGGHSRPRTQV